jgi:hypothetical protein
MEDRDHAGMSIICRTMVWPIFVFLFDVIVDYISKELCRSASEGCPFSTIMVTFFFCCCIYMSFIIFILFVEFFK